MSLKKNMIRTGVGLASLLSGTAALAQTASTTVTSAPGVPTTALGGEWLANALLLAVGAALITIGALMYKKEEKSVRI